MIKIYKVANLRPNIFSEGNHYRLHLETDSEDIELIFSDRALDYLKEEIEARKAHR